MDSNSLQDSGTRIFDILMKLIHYRKTCYDTCVYYNGEAHIDK